MALTSGLGWKITLFLLFSVSATYAQFVVTSSTPGHFANQVDPNANIVLTFSQNVESSTVNIFSIRVRGLFSGNISGTFSGGGTSTITFNPSGQLLAGETIRVTVTTAVFNVFGIPLARDHQFQFTVRSGPPEVMPPFFFERIYAAPDLRDIFVADIDRDGDVDVMGVSEVNNAVLWMENTGSRNFTTHIVSPNVPGAAGAHVCDIDGDGDMDLLTNGLDKIVWFENNGSQVFVERLVGNGVSSPSNPVEIVCVDLDGDRDIDIVEGNNGQLVWFENNGSQNFTERPISYETDGLGDISVADMDKDGDLDIVTTSAVGGFAWHENFGDQTFQKQAIPTSLNPNFALHQLRDVDADGDVDIYVSSFYSGVTALYENNGSNVFSEKPISALGTSYGVDVNDLDGDGDMDLISGAYNGAPVWHRNDGGAFTSKEVYVSAAQSTIVTDFDKDGDMDIVYNPPAGGLAIAENTSNVPTISAIGNVTTPEDVATAPIPFSLSDADTPPASLSVTATSDNQSVVDNASIAIAIVGPLSREIVVTPVNNASGVANITVTVSDGANSATEVFRVTVTPVNDTPAIVAQRSLTTPEETPITLVPGDITVVDPDDIYPTDFTFTILGGANFTRSGSTITPSINFNGNLVVPVVVNDGSINSPTFDLIIVVTPVNDPPVIDAMTAKVTLEDTPFTITASDFSITDPDDTYPTDFTVTIQSGANYTFAGNTVTPTAEYSGPLTIPVSISDGQASTGVFNYSVTVTPVNDVPVITGQVPLNTPQDIPITLSLNNLTVTDPDNIYPTDFTLIIQAGANYTFSGSTITPAAGFTGVLSVGIRVNDGVNNSSIFNVSIGVGTVNSSPVITGQNPLSTPEESPLTITFADLLVTDLDDPYPTGFTLTVLNGTGYTRTGNTITPNVNFNGVLTVPVRVNDGSSNSNVFDLSVNVTPVNDAPVITGQTPVSTPEETSITLTFSQLLVADVDNTYPTGFTLSAMDGANYTRSGNTITPALNFVGTLSVPVTVNDGAASSNVFNVTITVTPTNDAPLITGQNPLTTQEDTPIAISLSDLLVTDADNSYPTGFTLTILSGANYTRSGTTVTPNPNFNGTLTVGVVVNDGTSDSPLFGLSIAVTPVNDPPLITSQVPISIAGGTSFTILLTHLTVSDVDNTYPAGFTLQVQDGANYTRSGNTITPAANFNGTLNIPVTVNDGNINSNVFTFQITVNSNNVAPVIIAQANLATLEDKSITLLLSHLTVVDPDSPYPDAFTLTVKSGANYSVSGATITPATDFIGTLTVPVFVNDGLANSPDFNVSITVVSQNDPPAITSQRPLSTFKDTPYTIQPSDIDVLDSDNDYPEDFTFIVLAGANYTFSGTTITPASGYTGNLSIPMRVNDGIANSNLFAVQLAVDPGDPIIVVKDNGSGQVSGGNILFSPTSVGEGEIRTITIENTGTGDLLIEDIVVSPADFSIEGDLPSLIPAGGSADIKLSFSPSQIGSIDGRMTIVSNGNVTNFEINLEGTGTAEVEVFNVVTVNANGKHDFLKIRNIQYYPGNKVFIYTRWGDKVFEMTDYNNVDRVFMGMNEAGKVLNEGNYYYFVDRNDGSKPIKGFFLLRN